VHIGHPSARHRNEVAAKWTGATRESWNPQTRTANRPTPGEPPRSGDDGNLEGCGDAPRFRGPARRARIKRWRSPTHPQQPNARASHKARRLLVTSAASSPARTRALEIAGDGACQHDPGAIIVFEDERLLEGTGGDDQGSRANSQRRRSVQGPAERLRCRARLARQRPGREGVA